MTRLTRSDLISWSDTNESEGQLPELIRRLILASNDNVEILVMPFGDSIGRSGLDGYVKTSVGSTYVAERESIWEFGTNKDHVTKANGDFKKRTTETIAVFRQQELTYYCVTPRHWEEKCKWELDPGPVKQKVVGHWKNVRVYDVDDLLGWLSDCPSVEAWFSRKLGKASAGLRDIEGYWSNVARNGSGIVPYQVLLAGRDEAVQCVRSFFRDKSTTTLALPIASRSPAEIVPFVVAAILSSDNEKAVTNTVVVDSRSRWEQLIVEESGLGLIVTPQVQPSREELQQAISQKHRVAYCSASKSLELPRLSEFDLCRTLVASGMDEGRATQHAKQCGGNGEILLDRLSDLTAPVGTAGSNLDDRVKAACLLLGGWDGRHVADQEIFAILCGKLYGEIETTLVEDSLNPNGLLFRAAGKYRLLSPELAWIRHSSVITKTAVDAFADVIQYLLLDDDPTVGMPSKERLTAQFMGKRPEFSGTLRRNFVQTLAVIASIGTSRLRIDPSLHISFVDNIVRSTFKAASFQRWASFRDELSLIAEAAPDVLLDALERDLRSGGPLEEVMKHTDVGLFSSPAHIGILWALERLCWSADYLARATSILLKLASFPISARSGNNPVNSIQETLQLCCPQTNADSNIRQQVIHQMLLEDCCTAFPIVIGLLPEPYCSWMARDKPEWRDWAYGYRATFDPKQIGLECRFCVDLLLSLATDHSEHWCALIESFRKIDDDQFALILDYLEEKLTAGVFLDDEKRAIWETVNRIHVDLEWVARHRHKADETVIEEDDLSDPSHESEADFPREFQRSRKFGEKLLKVLTAATPQDSALAAAYAFLGGYGKHHHSNHFSKGYDYEGKQKQIADTQNAIVTDLARSEGLTGLRRLAAIEHVNAELVGHCLARSNPIQHVGMTDICPFFASPNKPDRLLASGFFSVWARARKGSLVHEVLPHMSQFDSSETKVEFLGCLPSTPEVWTFVDTLEEPLQRLYWRAIPYWRFNGEQFENVVAKLIQFDRADRAIKVLVGNRNRLTGHHEGLVFQALEALPSTVREQEESESESLRWELQELFIYLYSNAFSNAERLAWVEIRYSNLFNDDEGDEFQPRGTLAMFRDTPSLFIDMLTYFRWSDDGVFTQDSEFAQSLKIPLYRLFHALNELPGESDLCPMDDKTIAEWVGEVIQYATERRYVSATVSALADIMASKVWRLIESWPSQEVMKAINVLEKVDPEKVRSHLASGVYSSRGTHWVDDTGRQEKGQAAQMRSRAGELQRECPAAAYALREVAKRLDEEANQNIERSKWRM